MLKLGTIKKFSLLKDLFEVIADHGSASLTSISIISIGCGNSSADIRLYVSNIKGNIEIFYDKDTLEYFIKPMSSWDNIYVKRIDCSSTFSYEIVEYNAEKHVKLEGE